jgi:hypothetical protein
MQQMSLQLIHHNEGNVDIPQRAHDGFINATSLCQAASKKWNHYYDRPATKEFITELSTDTGIAASELIQSLKGGIVQGTWVHPQVAIHLGQWLSAKFAVKVSKWVYDWMQGKGAPSFQQKLPPHLQRYLGNDNRVPPGHFSILQEAALGLVGPLHQIGFDIPAGWVPDISIGRLFCAYLRDKYGVDTDSLPTYWHDYMDGRPLVSAKLYPEDFLVIYRNWFRQVWPPINGIAYFKKKDKNSLAFLDKMPALIAPTKPTPKPLPWRTATM